MSTAIRCQVGQYLELSSKIVMLIFILIALVEKIVLVSNEGSKCGRALRAFPDLKIEEKIVGGYDIGYYKYPWYAALITSDGSVSCGGALITPKLILSAAHCYKRYIQNQTKREDIMLKDVYKVMLGVYNKCLKEKTQRLFSTEKVYVHENYTQNVPYFDIALLVLTEDATGYDHICLPHKVFSTKSGEGFTPGLGTLRYHGPTPCTLHEARVLIYSDDDCRKMLNRTGTDPNKMQGIFCAGYLQGGIDTCQGDSGGPLQVLSENGRHVLMGIVSFGFRCASPGLLGVYTDVSQYLDWINRQAGHNLTPPGDGSVVLDEPPKKGVLQVPKKPVNIIIVQSGSNIIVINRKHKNKFRKKQKDRS